MATKGEVLRILLTLALAISVTSAGGEYCDGYHDKDGEWHDGFDCDHGFNVYCCGTWQNKTCCPYEGKYEDEKNDGVEIFNIIIRPLIYALITLCTAVTGCICVCCLVRANKKKRAQQAQQNAVIVGGNQPMPMNPQYTRPAATSAFAAGTYPTQQYTNDPYPQQQQQYTYGQQQYPNDPPPEYPGKQ
ncbi:protein shisa-4-like [Ptychodera flava]|uniref:protein shisa-4-like n=1 Tax=Ptychodera flava TaxID=63121 RepID=UPI003969FDF8